MQDSPVTTLKLLQQLPNVGPSIAKDLLLLGIGRPEDLKGKNAEALYLELEAQTKTRQDPCVLDTLMSVIHFAATGERKPWWHFTADRKENFKRED